MGPELLVSSDGAIATVTLSNPGKLNAITVAMWRELPRVMNALSAEDGVRCVVLRGAGEEAFAAGADAITAATCAARWRRSTRAGIRRWR
jgi:enoyl-CoA hydratase/carnithine racemase